MEEYLLADSPEMAVASVAMSSDEEAWLYELKPGSIVKPKWAELTEARN
jgi:hypothetical protein